jgi:anti-sigma B factor antagonist
MTTALTSPAISPTTPEDEGSAVAVTLSWPPETGHSAVDGGAGQARGMHIIELIGDVDVHLAARARDLLMSLPAQDTDLTVDVSRVRFIDTGGLGILATLYRRVNEAGGQLSLIGAAPSLRRILHVTDLTYLLAGDPACL